jgi:hypothetical protein
MIDKARYIGTEEISLIYCPSIMWKSLDASTHGSGAFIHEP